MIRVMPDISFDRMFTITASSVQHGLHFSYALSHSVRCSTEFGSLSVSSSIGLLLGQVPSISVKAGIDTAVILSMHQQDLGVEVLSNKQQFILSVQNVLAYKFVGRDRAISFLNTGAQCLRQSSESCENRRTICCTYHRVSVVICLQLCVYFVCIYRNTPHI